MSVIDITRHHTLDHDGAVRAADDLARSLSDQFDVSYQWSGDTLQFRRTGVKGRMEVTPSLIRIHMELGFLVRPFKGRIESEIHAHLDGLIDKA